MSFLECIAANSMPGTARIRSQPFSRSLSRPSRITGLANSRYPYSISQSCGRSGGSFSAKVANSSTADWLREPCPQIITPVLTIRSGLLQFFVSRFVALGLFRGLVLAALQTGPKTDGNRSTKRRGAQPMTVACHFGQVAGVRLRATGRQKRHHKDCVFHGISPFCRLAPRGPGKEGRGTAGRPDDSSNTTPGLGRSRLHTFPAPRGIVLFPYTPPTSHAQTEKRRTAHSPRHVQARTAPA